MGVGIVIVVAVIVVIALFCIHLSNNIVRLSNRCDNAWDQINAQLRGVLDEATGKWGIRVNRVELKAIDPPHSVQDSMEKQMRAERDRRAAILTAEGSKQSQILEAEGRRQAAILGAEGEKQASILRAEGEAAAIQNVFDAIHATLPWAVDVASGIEVSPGIKDGEKMRRFVAEVRRADCAELD